MIRSRLRPRALSLAFSVLTAAIAAQDPPSGNHCIECHREKTPKVVEEHLASPHAGRVGCADCHGGNADATEADAAHDKAQGFVGRPPASDLGRCGVCHGDEARAVGRSPHAAAVHYTGQPGCITCHGPHDVHRPTDIGGLCQRCHQDENDPGRVLAGKMVTLVNRAATDVKELGDMAINASTPLQERMLTREADRAQAIHRRVAAVSHALDPKGLGAVVGRLTEITRTAEAVADADLVDDRGFSRITVVVILCGVGLMLLALSLLLTYGSFRLVARWRGRNGKGTATHSAANANGGQR